MLAQEITDLHCRLTDQWHHSPTVGTLDGFLGLVEQNHLQNFLLWHEEDRARRDDLGADSVRQAKRSIDRFNQKRNDLVEQMDKHFVAELKPKESGCSFNSETPGMMVDRLSILALKYYHMNEEACRADASAEHRTKCQHKVAVITQQLNDLSGALTELLAGVQAGTRSFRVYYQFKMYNDATLNPELRIGAQLKAG